MQSYFKVPGHCSDSNKIVWVNSNFFFFLILRKCRKSLENTVRPSCNCFEWHTCIVMQYCPMANCHYVHNLWRIVRGGDSKHCYVLVIYLIMEEFQSKLLKEHCTQKKIWIHLMQNIFRNQTVKNLTILDNPFKRYDFSKFSLYSVKSLCRPHKLATVPCMGAQLPIGFVHRLSQIFNFLEYE